MSESSGVDSGGLLLPVHTHLAELDAFSDQLVARDEIVGDPHTAFGVFVSRGPRAHDPAAYAEVIEAIHEGFLLHYSIPRLLSESADEGLRLLAGDYLYALGLERLSLLGDSSAVSELSDLITLQAVIHSGGPLDLTDPDSLAWAIWSAALAAVACGGSSELQQLKAELVDEPDSLSTANRLRKWAGTRAADSGLSDAWAQVAEQVGFGSTLQAD